MEVETSSVSSSDAKKKGKGEMVVGGVKKFAGRLKDMLKSGMAKVTKKEEPERAEKPEVAIRVEKMGNLDDVNNAINFMREESIVFLDFSSMAKNPSRLKECIEKLKRASEQFNSHIVAVGESYLILSPSFAKVVRQKKSS